ncbi:DUF4097 family beta strand repeat-containing protein [Neobacillus thermocopriae]
MKEERKRILKMVEEGKLTVNEALTLLEELDKAQKTMDQKQEQIINDLSHTVHFEEAKKEDPVFTKYQSTKEKIFEFVDSAIKKVKEMDLDLNFGQSVEISHIFHHGNATMKEVEIDLANGSVNIVAWDQTDVRAECQAKVYRVDHQDQARQHFLRDMIFSLEGQKLRLMSQQKSMKVDTVLYVPKAQYEKMRVRVFNGSVSGENLQVNDLFIKTANGKINLDQMNGLKAEVETANGKIYVANSHIGEVMAETINGAITLDGDFQKAEAITFHGQISLHLSGNRCEWIHAKTFTAPIELSIPEGTSVSGELKTNLGGFHLDFADIQVLEEKSEKLQKSLRFHSTNQLDKILKIYADSKSGSITLKKAIR